MHIARGTTAPVLLDIERECAVYGVRELRRVSATDLIRSGRFFRLGRLSTALWFLPRADGASCRLHRCIQCHGGANKRLERLFINLVALMEIDGTPGARFEAGVEEA